MSLLVSEELQKQYVQINKKIDDLKLEFIDKLFESAGFITKSQKNEVENIIKKDFDDDFYNILETNQTNASNRIMVLEDIKYNEIFNEKTKDKIAQMAYENCYVEFALGAGHKCSPPASRQENQIRKVLLNWRSGGKIYYQIRELVLHICCSYYD